MHSRILLVLLAALLQVAVLPGQGRLQCMLRAGSLTECCCAVASAVGPSPQGAIEPAPSCCHGMAVNRGVDRVPGLDGKCSCGADARELLVAPSETTIGSADAVVWDGDDGPPQFLPPWSRGSALLEPSGVAMPVGVRAVPPAGTGPPLYVLLQVFLI